LTDDTDDSDNPDFLPKKEFSLHFYHPNGSKYSLKKLFTKQMIKTAL